MNEINKIIDTIYRSEEYSAIIKKIISKNKGGNNDLNEIWSEIAVSYLSNPDKICKIYNEGYLKYYFAQTVKNIVHSSTSPYAKKIKIIDMADSSLVADREDSSIREKEEYEETLEIVKKTMDQINCSYFDAQMFRFYFYDNLSYRDIERETGVDHSTIYTSVKKTVGKIQKKIRQNEKKYI